MHGVHEHGDGGNQLGKLSGRFEAIHKRHDEIENDEIGLEFLSLGDGFLSIGGLDDFPGSGRDKDSSQCGANRRIILGNENQGCHENGKAEETVGAGQSCFPTTFDALRKYHEVLSHQYSKLCRPYRESAGGFQILNEG